MASIAIEAIAEIDNEIDAEVSHINYFRGILDENAAKTNKIEIANENLKKYISYMEDRIIQIESSINQN